MKILCSLILLVFAGCGIMRYDSNAGLVFIQQEPQGMTSQEFVQLGYWNPEYYVIIENGIEMVYWNGIVIGSFSGGRLNHWNGPMIRQGGPTYSPVMKHR